MRLLLDTCTFVWWIGAVERLAKPIIDAIDDAANEIFVSAVTPWEIAIKRKLGRADVPAHPDEKMRNAVESQGLVVLPISWTHGVRAGELPLHHRDPFDRMLVAQAQVERLTIVSPDPLFSPYEVEVMWR